MGDTENRKSIGILYFLFSVSLKLNCSKNSLLILKSSPLFSSVISNKVQFHKRCNCRNSIVIWLLKNFRQCVVRDRKAIDMYLKNNCFTNLAHVTKKKAADVEEKELFCWLVAYLKVWLHSLLQFIWIFYSWYQSHK